MIDFHAHILPEMDDGSDSVDMTQRMLRASARQGVEEIVATPHFYADREDPRTFLKRRGAALEKVVPIYTRYSNLPELRLGAEVRYFDGMSIAGDIEQLCIQDTTLMLIEMPFRSWTYSMMEELARMQGRGITPILAHVDRYEAFRKGDLLRKLRQSGVILQMNADALLHGLRSWRAMYRVKNGDIQLLGSDCHSMRVRRPNLLEAKEVIDRGCGANVMEKLARNAEALLYE